MCQKTLHVENYRVSDKGILIPSISDKQTCMYINSIQNKAQLHTSYTRNYRVDFVSCTVARGVLATSGSDQPMTSGSISHLLFLALKRHKDLESRPDQYY